MFFLCGFCFIGVVWYFGNLIWIFFVGFVFVLFGVECFIVKFLK